MREFKFRFWDKNKEDMYFWDMRKGQSERDYDESHIIMQYTGLKDKNGVEIYEGDIFTNIQAQENEVIFAYSQWCYSNFHAGALPLDDGTEKQIIGNIHENPEL